MKNRRVILLFLLFIPFILTACSKEDLTLEKRFDEYIDYWKKYEFDEMYSMFAKKSLKNYTSEDVVERYEKIYEDLQIENLSITYEPLSKEDLKKAIEVRKVTIPFSASMDTIAGEISFDYKATLIQEEVKDEEYEWFIEWDPGYIFPPLKDGGEINIQSERPKRGEILDRNKMPLAMNDLVYEIGVVPGELEEQGELEEVARLLKVSTDFIEKALSANWVKPDLYVPLKEVPQTEQETIQQLKNLKSIKMRETTGRVYPAGKAASHIIGYVGPITAEELEEKDKTIYSPNDIVGKYGLERIYDQQLKGEQGVKILVTREEGEDVLLAEKEVKHGENIELTLDINIQQELFSAYGEKAGTAAAIDPKTGETLALVSSPAFDPNELVYGNISEIMERLENDPLQPMLNRFTATFAPGSALKPITASVGMMNGTLDPEEGLEIKGLTWSGGEGWGDYKVRRVSEGQGPVDLRDALVRSDNIYFAMQAVKMGSNAFIEGFHSFGFEEEFPFVYPFTQSTVSSTGEIDHEVLLANTSYGQGEIETSSLHLALMYTPFLNKGDLLKPLLLLEEEPKQVWKEKLIEPKDAELFQEILLDVVEKGTAKSAIRDEFPIAGKTGTAELKLSSEQSGKENGWFVGFPAEDQDILIAMMIEGVENLDGSSYVADKVADVLVNIKKQQ